MSSKLVSLGCAHRDRVHTCVYKNKYVYVISVYVVLCSALIYYLFIPCAMQT